MQDASTTSAPNNEMSVQWRPIEMSSIDLSSLDAIFGAARREYVWRWLPMSAHRVVRNSRKRCSSTLHAVRDRHEEVGEVVGK
jgi:hypothetical protein